MLSYNGVSLSYTNTLSVDQGPEKDPSGTDTIFFRTTLTVKAIIGGGLTPQTGGEAIPVTASRITELLCLPRRPLLYAPDGSNYLINLPGGLDDANGPEPDVAAFRIQEITPGSYAVQFTVTVRQTLCQQSLSRPYLSLRWTEATDIGADWLQVKRRSGLLICSSRSPVAPDDLRFLITPGIGPGFRREQADYQLDETGLRLKFTFLDRQLARAVPYPLTDFDGQMSEIVTTNGLARKGDFRMKANAPPGVHPRMMLNVVLMMAMSRVYSTNPFRSSNGTILLNGAIGERLSTKENAIDVHLNWDIMPAKAREKPSESVLRGSAGSAWIGSVLGGIFGGPVGGVIGGIGGELAGGGAASGTIVNETPQAAVSVFAAWMGQPFPFEDPTRGIAPPTRGIAPWVKLAAAVLNDPCGQQATISASGGWSVIGTDGTATVTGTVVPEVVPSDEQSLYSDETAGVWQEYRVGCTYLDDSGRRVMSTTSPDKDNAIVRVGSRTLTLQVGFHLTRKGAKTGEPKFAERNDPNWVYIRSSTTLENVRLAADGFTPIYESAGVWEFAALNIGTVQIKYPIPPFLEAALVEQATPPATASGATAGTGGAASGWPGIVSTAIGVMSGNGVIQANGPFPSYLSIALSVVGVNVPSTSTPVGP